MTLTRRSSLADKRALTRTFGWVTAWLVAGGALALLLLANSVQSYLFVSRLVTVQQVRQKLSEDMVDLEQRLRRAATPEPSLAEQLAAAVDEASDKPLWIEIRRADGTVVARHGSGGTRLFTSDEESTHFRNREALHKVVTVDGGEAVVEVFPFRALGVGALAPPDTVPPGPRRSLVVVEIAAPLAVRDPAALWAIRRNLFINGSAALALLATVVVAGLGFRSYARGRRLESQLEIAREVQAELLPSSSESCEPVSLATVYRPAEQVSGDFYDVFRTDEGRVAILLGDVSGKGVPAALVMGVIHGAVRASDWTASTSAHERESGRLNLLLCENEASQYASMFWCYYDAPARRLSYVNAGHHPPLLVGERARGIEITSLDAGGPVLGLLPTAQYEQSACEVRPGDVLVLYSDGLVEAASPAGEEYGSDRVRQSIVAAGAGSPEEIRDAIVASATAFAGSAPFIDDLTLVVAKLE